MKRVLFYYDNYCGEKSKGGTEVSTFRIASALKEDGITEVFHAYRHKRKDKGKKEKSIYESEIRLDFQGEKSVVELSDFISDNKIDYVVNMGRFFRQEKLQRSILKSGRDAKLFFMHHFAPGSEKMKGTYSSGWHLLKLNPYNPLYYLRATVYPLLKLPRISGLKKIYRKVYEISDRIILLSDGYKEKYREIADISDESKMVAIPNIFDAPQPLDRISPKKEKRVLILSRMDEIQKRISLALKIWKRIEEEPALNYWHLDIVGDGHDAGIYKRLARKLGLKRVTFHGWKNGREFLERCSVLMMPSLYEGLSLSMLEAQAYGCVPIAYDSYASLKDIVKPGETGVIVNGFGDVESFARKLINLMKNGEERTKMAERAQINSDRFSSQKIAERWKNLLT